MVTDGHSETTTARHQEHLSQTKPHTTKRVIKSCIAPNIPNPTLSQPSLPSPPTSPPAPVAPQPATSGNPLDSEGGNGTASDIMLVLLGSDIEDSDFFIETKESEDSSSNSDRDLGDDQTDQPSQQRS
ncbi:hypothetical protein E2C01_027293 [Portunus trituberculatus]|uniref:Uncharacterized protein n=1 Tax=Portunus trituberculatus TaxID=210409 RepID=A0A5B7EKG3_PORTR|nr:hypothetical protein [Portunus trituberculatus]